VVEANWDPDREEPVMPTVSPMLAYEDAAAALEWLAKAFGFRERTRIEMPDGSIGHAEMEIGDGILMLAGPTPEYQSPKRHADTCEAARRWSAVPYVINGVHVYVDDVDAHYQQAHQAGATILSPPGDSPHGRLYRAADLEGQRWMFMQRPRA
jgi:PhnB protein